ncbi:SR protein-specific kinase Dsk1 [Reticulomyxa filosa]|uniref:SR protein-specific kinase Dsk1 n=1 Tax=Reticulomyxa filosa TaxID=46433 RepID=X6N272_RETFI|nr:SR protein-specific kinase Dsk1 [Reticulomyxa filosa]|eukprot:ETO19844.1 SR protein-specific kinase Dsk1 [Reticulomyxa filosa]
MENSKDLGEKLETSTEDWTKSDGSVNIEKLLKLKHEKKLFLNRYEIKELLGEGTFSRTISVYDVVTQRNYALKIMHKNYKKEGLQEYQKLQEINEKCKQMEEKHQKNQLREKACNLDECMIECYGAFLLNDAHYCILLELLGPSLYTHIIQANKVKKTRVEVFSIGQIQGIARQLISALFFLHGNGYIHADLKPENILFQNQSPHSQQGAHHRLTQAVALSDLTDDYSTIVPRNKRVKRMTQVHSLQGVTIGAHAGTGTSMNMAVTTTGTGVDVDVDMDMMNMTMNANMNMNIGMGMGMNMGMSMGMNVDIDMDSKMEKVSSYVNIKVVDFGNVIPWKTLHKYHKNCRQVQSLFYRAPEVLLGYPFDASIDIWSVGCVLVELLIGILLLLLLLLFFFFLNC